MKRNSIRKASTFKLQAARARFLGFLDEVEACPVARKWPTHLDEIRRSSEKVFEMCYGVREDSPFLRGLNYDCRYSGFRSSDNIMVYRDYLGHVDQAFLYGDFNGFNRELHKLVADEEMGQGWWRVEFDLNVYRLEEGSRVMVRTVKGEQENCFPPPSCFFLQKGEGIFRKETNKAQHASKHKVAHLLAYTIDLENTSLKECLSFIEAEIDLLECYNIVILKNLFSKEHGPLHRFSLSSEQADQLEQIVERLSRANVKVVIEWNFDEVELSEEPSPLQEAYFRQTATANYQFDLTRDPVLTYFLSAVAHYIKYYGIGGIHFTKVHKICKEPNGEILVRLINLLCERLREDTITLASSKEFIAGLTWPILEGGLGFSFTYNFHESLSLRQQHESIYEMVKQIQSSSNCLSLDFTNLQPHEHIYLLFTFLIARRGVFTRGPVGALREELKKALKLRRQEELFSQECTMERIDEDCMVVSRGNTLILFNFSQKTLPITVSALKQRKVVFNQTDAEVVLAVDEEGDGKLEMSPLNCLMLQAQ